MTEVYQSCLHGTSVYCSCLGLLNSGIVTPFSALIIFYQLYKKNTGVIHVLNKLCLLDLKLVSVNCKNLIFGGRL